jgi:Ca2+-binding RTX toxin-like protein
MLELIGNIGAFVTGTVADAFSSDDKRAAEEEEGEGPAGDMMAANETGGDLLAEAFAEDIGSGDETPVDTMDIFANDAPPETDALRSLFDFLDEEPGRDAHRPDEQTSEPMEYGVEEIATAPIILTARDAGGAMSGGLAGDTLVGGGGRDLLQGGSGGDLLIGVEMTDDGAPVPQEADQLNGGAGNDALILGAGDHGHGGGADLFALAGWPAAGDAGTVIEDYDPRQDRIVVLYDAAAHPDPVLTVASAADDPADALLHMNGQFLARVAGGAG